MRLLSNRRPSLPLVNLARPLTKGKRDYFRQLVGHYGYQGNIVEMGRAPHEDSQKHPGLLRACVIPFPTDPFLSRVALPIRFFEYTACGKPILSTELPEAKKAGGDLVFFYHNAVEFSKQAKRLLGESKLADDVGLKSCHLAREHDWNIVAANLKMLSQKYRFSSSK